MTKGEKNNNAEKLRRLLEERRQCRVRKEAARRKIEENKLMMEILERRRFVRGHLYLVELTASH
jgi:hypothetical protein